MRRFAIPLILLLSFGGAGAARLLLLDTSPQEQLSTLETGPAERVISLVPSMTETLFALGAGDAVVGVTRYCAHPPEAQTKSIVGGFVDPNYEAILVLQPDLVVVSGYAPFTTEVLESFDIRCISMPHDTLEEIYATIETLGRETARFDAAAKIVSTMRARYAAVQAQTAGAPRATVLISVGRDVTASDLGQVYATAGGYLNELLAAAGGVNVLQEGAVAYPVLGPEALLNLDPDIIIDIAPHVSTLGLTEEQALTAWHAFPQLRAVAENRVHLLTGDYIDIPGPRLMQALDDLVQALHPDLVKAAA